MKCCGEERTTPFCPICGLELQGTRTLYGLLRHCRTQQAALEVKIADREAFDKREGRSQHPFPSKERQTKNAAEKWKTWADELQKLLNTQDNGEQK